VVVDHPANHAEITIRGGWAVPLFSPRLDPAFDTSRSFQDACTALRAANIRLFALNTDHPMAQTFIAAHPFLNTLTHAYAPVAKVGTLTIYDLASLKPRRP
jgi:hypothetical protein